MYYPPHSYPKRKILTIAGSFYGAWVLIECGFAIWLRHVYANGTTWPNLIFGIIASIFLAVGLLPPYFELAKRCGRVVGINFVFLAMDSSGAIFSLASLAIGDIDIMGMILYAIVLALEIGLFASHAIWYLRFGKIESDIEVNGSSTDAVNADAFIDDKSHLQSINSSPATSNDV